MRRSVSRRGDLRSAVRHGQETGRNLIGLSRNLQFAMIILQFAIFFNTHTTLGHGDKPRGSTWSCQ
jgi:hypothetical protein